jgi:hypothetical protein
MVIIPWYFNFCLKKRSKFFFAKSSYKGRDFVGFGEKWSAVKPLMLQIFLFQSFWEKWSLVKPLMLQMFLFQSFWEKWSLVKPLMLQIFLFQSFWEKWSLVKPLMLQIFLFQLPGSAFCYLVRYIRIYLSILCVGCTCRILYIHM